MSEIVTVTLDWLTSTGAPNAVVLLLAFTHPSTWTTALRKRIRPLVDRVLPAGGGEGSE